MFNEIQKEIVLQDYECPTCGEKINQRYDYLSRISV